MSWSTVPTFNVGDILTAATMNIVSGDINLLGGAKSSPVTASGTVVTQTSYGNMTTGVTPTVTVTTLTTALVIVSALDSPSVNNDGHFIGFTVSGGSTVAASDNNAAVIQGTIGAQASIARTMYVTGLTASNNNIFTAQFKTHGTSTMNLTNVSIAVIPLTT